MYDSPCLAIHWNASLRSWLIQLSKRLSVTGMSGACGREGGVAGLRSGSEDTVVAVDGQSAPTTLAGACQRSRAAQKALFCRANKHVPNMQGGYRHGGCAHATGGCLLVVAESGHILRLSYDL